MAAFPSTLILSKNAQFTNDKRVSSYMAPDGTLSQYTVGTNDWIRIKCQFNTLNSTERSTLKNFLSTNRAGTVTMTIDSINYSGIIVDGHSETAVREGYYNIEFTYLAEEV